MEIAALPPGVLAFVFEHLDLSSRLRARRVCRDWRGGAAVGCAHLRVKVPNGPNSIYNNPRVGRVRFRGHRSRLSLEGDGATEEGATACGRGRWMTRTRGHLPQPVVLGAGADAEETAPHRLQQTRSSGAALLVDRSAVSLRNQLEAQNAAGESEEEEDDDTDSGDGDDGEEAALSAPDMGNKPFRSDYPTTG